jgi:segregation and condensation protein A
VATQENTPLRVETEVFEGPFDLLLHLVHVNEMDIFDINIAQITDHYLAHLAQMDRQNLEIAGEFLVMAATLLNIKSRTLLPANPHVDDDEEEEEGGAILSTEDLVRQLIEYRRFKEIAQVLGEREMSQMRVYYRSHLPPKPQSQEEEPSVAPQEIDALLGAFARVIAAIGIDKRHEVFEEEASVEDALARVRGRIGEQSHTRLSELLQNCRTVTQAVVVVLALLEMTKLREIRIEQAKFYDDIHVIRRDDAPQLPPPTEELGPTEVIAEETPAAESAAEESNG